MLISSIINCEIPQEIQYLKPKNYQEFRDNYSDICEPFHRIINDLGNLYRLENIEDEKTLQDRVNEITQDFNSEVEKFKKSNFGSTFKRWMPFGIGSLASLAGAAFSEPMVSIGSASVGVIIQIIQESTNVKEPESEQSKVHRIIANMWKDILKKPEISKLV